jgi:hypothetical protein
VGVRDVNDHFATDRPPGDPSVDGMSIAETNPVWRYAMSRSLVELTTERQQQSAFVSAPLLHDYPDERVRVELGVLDNLDDGGNIALAVGEREQKRLRLGRQDLPVDWKAGCANGDMIFAGSPEARAAPKGDTRSIVSE